MAVTTSNQDLKVNVLNELKNFGLYQKLQYLVILVPFAFVAMAHCNYIFVAENMHYRCLMPECGNEDFSIKKPSWWPAHVDSKCKRPVIDPIKFGPANFTCSKDVFYEEFEDCHEWIYEHNNSIVAGLNLACKPWKPKLVGGIHNAGMILSTLSIGLLSDKFGRKPTTIFCSVFGFVGVFKIFSTNYYGYLAIEFFESVFASGIYTTGVVLLIEVGGETKRVFTGVMFAYSVYVGEITYALVAMGLVYWKSIVLFIYTPMVIFLVNIFLMKESNRWLMVHGKWDKARRLLKLISRYNKCNVTSAEIDNATPNELRAVFHVEESVVKEGLKAIISSKEIMVRLAVSSFCFFTSTLLYYASLIYAVFLPGNKYHNFILGAFVSFPADYIAFIAFQKFGRKLTLQVSYVFAAFFLITQNYCPISIIWLNVILFLMGKLFVVIGTTGLYIYSMELFPTSVRGSLLGCSNTAARLGSMLAPLTPLLMIIWNSLPAVLFAVGAMTASGLTTFLPETMTLPMFDTIAQIEAYKENNAAQKGKHAGPVIIH